MSDKELEALEAKYNKRLEVFNEIMPTGAVTKVWAMENILGLSKSEVEERLKKEK